MVNVALAVIACGVAGAAAMTTNPNGPAAGGFPIAAGVIGGAGVGLALGQPTLGLLIGLALGTALATAIWLRAR